MRDIPKLDYERLYRDVIPSVVSVYRGDDERSGSGSGFVYDREHVVTNEHVVRGVRRVLVRLHDGRWFDGHVVGVDRYTDLAAIRIPDLPPEAPPLPLAAENPAPGRLVAALGNPLGLDGSITAGIVSGSNRSMAVSGGFTVPDVVQTDAPINPGNSGGPLVALREPERAADGDEEDGGNEDDSADSADPAKPVYEVVGVNRAKQGDNIGFAVSPTVARRVVPALVSAGRYRHSFLRARTLDATPAVARANGLAEPGGVLVVDARGDGSGRDGLRGADGVRRERETEIPVGGDVIVGIDGTEVRSHEELMRYLLAETSPGDAVSLRVLRDGRPAEVTVTLGERPNPDSGSRIIVE